MSGYAVCGMWYAVCGFLAPVRRVDAAAKQPYHLPPTAYRLPPTAHRLPPTAYHLPPTAYRLPPTTYHLPPTAYRLPPTAYRLPPTAHRLPPTAHRLPRKGVSLMEVLISTFVIAIGLLGLAALIPVGRFTLVEAGKADRAGACGRAAMRDVKVRGMLENYSYWSPPPIPPDTTNIPPFAIDPLGVNAGLLDLSPAPNQILRRSLLNPITLFQLTTSEAQSIFHWHDDLVFHMPEDRTLRPTQLPTGLEYEGSYSWFITVVPAASENDRPGFPGTGVQLRNKTLYTVSVVVCYKRDLGLDGGIPTGEHTATVNQFYGGGYGGGSVRMTITSTGEVNMREGQWIMLHGIDAVSGRTQCSWYRLVTVGEVDINFPNDRYLSLAGPDWTIPAANTTAVIVDGVIGVYTTTIELNR